MDIRANVQRALDAALFDTGVRVFWRRRAEVLGAAADEYVVYTLGSDTAEAHADDTPLLRAANVAVRYYYRDTMLETPVGRATVMEREHTIHDALVTAGFSLPSGYFDAGDIDDIGFSTTIFECDFWRVV